MKKVMALIVAMAMMVGSVYVAGCTPEQKQAVANQLGFAAGVSWVGLDNPSSNEIVSVKAVLQVIETASNTNCLGTNCSDNASIDYYDRLYPVAEQFIVDKLEPNQQPMARLGAAFILSSLNMAFKMNPSWSKNADEASGIINAFCKGAEKGIALSPNDPVAVAYRKQMPVRMVAGKVMRK